MDFQKLATETPRNLPPVDRVVTLGPYGIPYLEQSYIPAMTTKVARSLVGRTYMGEYMQPDLRKLSLVEGYQRIRTVERRRACLKAKVLEITTSMLGEWEVFYIKVHVKEFGPMAEYFRKDVSLDSSFKLHLRWDIIGSNRRHPFKLNGKSHVYPESNVTAFHAFDYGGYQLTPLVDLTTGEKK
ncbi:hypothetical protein [Vibrio phage BONAISHI]|nr:hypothetical protein [Vibrio phage BONAISHI]